MDEVTLIVITGTIAILILLASIIFFVVKYNNKIFKLELEKQKGMINAEISSQERERERISRELHDSVGGVLTGTKLLVENLARKEGLTADQSSKELERIKGAIKEATEGVRSIVRDLAAHRLEAYGLHTACAELLELVNTDEFATTFKFEGNEDHLELAQKLTAYRIIQEILNNAIKHSHPSRFDVIINHQNKVTNIVVEYDGALFEFESAKASSNGLGLLNIDSRVQYLNGDLAFSSANQVNKYTITF